MKDTYRYATSEKSYLDVKHDPLWNSAVEWIYSNYPAVTPNHLTLIGAIPMILIMLLYILGFVDSYVFPIISILIIVYLNFDSMDGKLARLSARSSPVGQVLDHGLDSFIGGLLSIVVLKFLGFESVVFMSIAVAMTTSLFYMCNLKEHVTGEMIVSTRIWIGSEYIVVGTTELLYALSAFFLVGRYVFYPNGYFVWVLVIESAGGIAYLLVSLNSMIVESTSVISRDGANTKVPIKKKSKVYDSNMKPTGEYVEFEIVPENVSENKSPNSTIKNYYINMMAINRIVCFINYILSGGSPFNLVMFVVYATYDTVNLIFSNTMKIETYDRMYRVLAERLLDKIGIVVLVLKLTLSIVFWIIRLPVQEYTIIVDIVYLAVIATTFYEKAKSTDTYLKVKLE